MLYRVIELKNQNIKTYGFWIVFTEAVGLLSGLITRKGMELYANTVIKPPLTPPGIVFPIVWTILYALMGIGAARVQLSDESPARAKGTLLYLTQLLFNFFWSILFFTVGNYPLAYFWLLALWGLVIGMILAFRKVDKTAAYLQIPYFLWLTFAACLNYGVWALNR